jgi:hypothetical protein
MSEVRKLSVKIERAGENLDGKSQMSSKDAESQRKPPNGRDLPVVPPCLAVQVVLEALTTPLSSRISNAG